MILLLIIFHIFITYLCLFVFECLIILQMKEDSFYDLFICNLMIFFIFMNSLIWSLLVFYPVYLTPFSFTNLFLFFVLYFNMFAFIAGSLIVFPL